MPTAGFRFFIDSHADTRQVRTIWYNNILRGGTWNEAGFTGFGGARSALLDPDSTGAWRFCLPDTAQWFHSKASRSLSRQPFTVPCCALQLIGRMRNYVSLIPTK